MFVEISASLPQKHEEGVGKSPDGFHISNFLSCIAFSLVVHLVNPRGTKNVVFITIWTVEEGIIFFNDTDWNSAHVESNINLNKNIPL